MAVEFRQNLAYLLGLENPTYPGHIYWETSGRSDFPCILMQEIQDESLLVDLRVDYSFAGLQHLFNSYTFVGDEVYKYIANVIELDIYIFRITKEDVHRHLRITTPGIQRDAIMILGNEYHYEVLALNTGNGFQTIFPPGDKLRRAADNLFPSKEEVLPYDPDETFITCFIDTFTVDNILVIPPKIYEIFPYPEDPFRKILDRLIPRIQQAVTFMENLKSQSPILTQLDEILNIMRQQLVNEDTLSHIRKVVQPYVTVNIYQTLDDILAEIEEDGALSSDIIEYIRNVQVTL